MRSPHSGKLQPSKRELLWPGRARSVTGAAGRPGILMGTPGTRPPLTKVTEEGKRTLKSSEARDKEATDGDDKG